MLTRILTVNREQYIQEHALKESDKIKQVFQKIFISFFYYNNKTLGPFKVSRLDVLHLKLQSIKTKYSICSTLQNTRSLLLQDILQKHSFYKEDYNSSSMHIKTDT